MFIVGLTGGIATGKTTVLTIFKENGVAVIDADEVARKVIEPGTSGWSLLREKFGDAIFYPDGRVNRTVLGELIFNDVEKRKVLNNITHPRIQHAMVRMAISYFFSGYPYVVMELPLLFETRKMFAFMHKIITVVCEDDQQLDRLCKRNEFSMEVAQSRIKSQMPLDHKVANSHFVIDNSADVAHTKRQTEQIVKVLQASRFHWYVRAAVTSVVLGVLCGCAYTVTFFF